MKSRGQFLSIFLSVNLLFAPLTLEGCSKSTAGAPHSAQSTGQAQSAPAQSQQAPATTQAEPTPDELYQLVAPIALFPDNLVALVLAASTYPDQITAANTWLGQNSSLKGDALSKAVDGQSWDNSVKGLTQFPDVMTQMATNLSWTSALGDAYVNTPQDVMNAVQVMRKRAEDSGNLKSNDKQTVSTQAPAATAAAAPAAPIIVQAPPQTIIIQPAQPTVVYVPAYNPTVVYGAPVAPYPGYSTGAVVATGIISFGLGIAVGAAIANNNHCCGWGYNSWGCGWHSSTVVYNRNVYVSRSTTVVNRNNYYGHNNVNINNVNRNNVNVNNVNRNNVNVNNVNHNNVNQNNVNRNNANPNNRTNNFSTPNFSQTRNQPQFANSHATASNNRGGQNNLGGQNRATPNQGRANAAPAQRDAARGYGAQQGAHGTSNSAFSNYSGGGKTQTNSNRGAQSLQGQHSKPASRPAPQRSGGGGRHR
jgi:hypothetical protein